MQALLPGLTVAGALIPVIVALRNRRAPVPVPVRVARRRRDTRGSLGRQ